MRILHRYLTRELVTPTLLGLFLFTTILVMNRLFDISDLAVKRDLPFVDVLRLLSLFLPPLMAETIPMAVLLGTLLAFSRLSADSEIVALRASGVSAFQLIKPVVVLAGVAFAVCLALMHWLVPLANHQVGLEKVRLVAETDLTREIQPRVFFEKIPDTVIYADGVSPDDGQLHRLFLYRKGEDNRPEIYLARRASFDRRDGGLLLVMDEGEQHWVRADDPGDYHRSTFQKESLNPYRRGMLIPRQAGRPPQRKGPREQTLRELLVSLEEAREEANPKVAARLERIFRVEIHKKFALPAACLVLALIAIPIGITTRRGNRFSGFAISVGVILVYYVLLINGEELARDGQWAPWFAMWLPNLLIFGAASGLLFFQGRRRWAPPAHPGGSGGVGRWLRLPQVRPRRRVRVTLRLPRYRGKAPQRLDRYVLTTLGQVFLLLVAAFWTISVIVQYFELSPRLVDEATTGERLIQYFCFHTPSLLIYILPMGALVTVLVALAMMSRSNELTAIKASGISLYRVLLPLLLAGGALSLGHFVLSDWIVPTAASRANQIKDTLRGRAPRTYRQYGRRWTLGREGRLFYYQAYNPNAKEFFGLEVFDFSSDYSLDRRWYAQRAAWDRGAWVFQDGWRRRFSTGQEAFERFAEKRVPLPEGPDYFSDEEAEEHSFLRRSLRSIHLQRRAPEQLSFLGLYRYLRDMRNRGYHARPLWVELFKKPALSLAPLILVIFAIPCALSYGRKGAMVGVGLALAVAFVYYGCLAVFTALGKFGAFPPWLAALAPDILFGGVAVYWYLRIDT